MATLRRSTPRRRRVAGGMHDPDKTGPVFTLIFTDFPNNNSQLKAISPH